MNQPARIQPWNGGTVATQSLFADLIADTTAIIDTASLEKDKMTLVGVPMVITRVTYRPKAALVERGFVSVEAVVGDEEHVTNAIRRGWIPTVETVDQFPFAYEEKIVFNDGSTGIRRQLTAILHAQGYINVGEFVDNSTFDIDWSEWESFNSVTTQKVGDEMIEIPDFPDLRIFARRGLRVSEYTADGIGDATTFYLA